MLRRSLAPAYTAVVVDREQTAVQRHHEGCARMDCCWVLNAPNAELKAFETQAE